MARSTVAGVLIPLGLDRAERAPLHRQLYGQLRDMILAGRVAPAERLPSTRELARELGVGRNTILAAFDQLLAEGFLEARVGAGTFVARDLPALAAPVRRRAPTGAGASPRVGRASAHGLALGATMARAGPVHRAFVPSLPALDAFPHALWARLLTRSWRGRAADLPIGEEAVDHPALSAAIAAYLGTARAVRAAAGQVLLVGGSQQAIGLAARVLLRPGDQALVEDPGYPGARGALLGADARLVPVPVDDEGLDIERGEGKAPGARLACVTPSHQFPLGAIMSLARRLSLLEWARRRRAWIVEDDYDSEFRYRGRPLAALQGLDESGRVIYVGSFSKTMFPALRLAYLVVPADLVATFRRVRAALGYAASCVAQPAVARFLAEGHLSAHVRRVRQLYLDRQRALVGAAEHHLAGLATVRASDAGMHLVARFGPRLALRLDDRSAAAHGEAK